VNTINYIPAYLESILLNLITNAIKYKHQDRDPVVEIKSYSIGSKEYLKVADNGRGIDMKLFKDKIFGMYKTFHYNKDAVGIGLFLTKNQVESLDGKITVESEVDKGTTFIIEF
jgi:signal transduction histidine kinase